MDKSAQLWNEYESLRDELKSADSLNYQIVGLLVGAVAAILTAGFTQTNPMARLAIFLCVYVVSVPGYRMLQGNRRRIWRITTYMQVFLEPQLEFINWATRVDKQRRKARDRSERRFLSSLVSMNEWLIVSAVNSLAALAAICSGLLVINSTALVRVAGIVAVVVWYAFLLITTARQEKDLRRLGRVEQAYLQYWTEIRDEESNENGC